MATRLQGLPPSRLSDSAVPPSPTVRVLTWAAVEVQEPGYAGPVCVPENRGRDGVGDAESGGELGELDSVGDPVGAESGERVEVRGIGEVGRGVSVSGSTGRVVLLGIRG